jgi:TPR repeat protein
VATPGAADFVAGVKAYDRGDYAAAFEAWSPLAQNDDPAAQRNIGHLYRFGLGVGQDFERAAFWYREAAEMGLPGAQANLAMMYLRGQGLIADARQAAQWFSQAAVQGHAISQYNLGLLYLKGHGLPRDEARAMGWFHLAAKGGHIQALEALSKLVLGSALLPGPSTPPGWRPPSGSPQEGKAAARPETAAEAKKEAPAETETKQAAPAAARRGQPKPGGETASIDSLDTAYTVLSNAFRGDFSIPAKPRPTEAGEDRTVKAPAEPPPVPKEEPTPPTPKSASKSDGLRPATDDHERGAAGQGRFSRAIVAYRGGDYEAARRRLLPLARAGMVDAQYHLGRLYNRPDFASADRVEAYVWLTLAAEQGHPQAKSAKSGLMEKMDVGERQRARVLLNARRGDHGSKRPRL